MTDWKLLDRENRGLLIAAKSHIKRRGDLYLVPSQSGQGKYEVLIDTDKPRCDCQDFLNRGVECKHIYAVRFYVQRQQNDDGSETVTETVQVTQTVKRTYRQNWPAYNAAQTSEKRHFQTLLHDLCAKVENPSQRTGRPRLPLPDALFSAIFKVYSTVSGRRFMSDLAEAKERGHVNRLPHYNSVFNVMEDPAVTPILRQMVELSGLPLKSVECDFAADSSGFSCSRFVRWFDHKYGGERKAHAWVKCHIMCGVKTNVVTAVEIQEPYANDAAQMPALIETTARNFKMAEVSGDGAYLTHQNMAAIERHGAVPFITFRPSSVSTEKHPPIWRKMFHLFQYNRDEYMAHYHKRSNVETTFSMVKAKFRDHLRSKTDVAMVNECLCKFICHNVCCVISAIHELNIEMPFWAESQVAQKVADF